MDWTLEGKKIEVGGWREIRAQSKEAIIGAKVKS